MRRVRRTALAPTLALVRARMCMCMALLFAWTAALNADPAPTLELCVIVGAPGEPAFDETFEQAATAWTDAAGRGGARVTIIGNDDATASDDRSRVRDWIAARSEETQPPLWIVYLGHGSYDGRDARLNLRGPDLTAAELAGWLNEVRRPVVLVHGGSASAPFLTALSRPGRIIITATRSGHETNYARFGGYFAQAIASTEADIDRDGQTSLLESFVTAARRVRAFYDENARLVTEHPLIDDNGDGQGTPADWFRGTRVIRQPEGSHEPDGDRARLIALVPTEAERELAPEQRERRDQLERELAALRARKEAMASEAYDAALEAILRQLASVYGADS